MRVNGRYIGFFLVRLTRGRMTGNMVWELVPILVLHIGLLKVGTEVY